MQGSRTSVSACPEDSSLPGEQPRYNYIGRTMTSLHNRMSSHVYGRDRNQSNNALPRHEREVHNNEKQTYSSRILSRERTNLPLNLIEGLYIEKQRLGTTMNERNENGRGGLVRLTATRII